MNACKSCGTEMSERVNHCPKCGLSPGPATITSLPRQIKRHNKKRKKSGAGEREVRACGNCGTEVPKRVNLCPRCGLNPGVETITSVYRNSGLS